MALADEHRNRGALHGVNGALDGIRRKMAVKSAGTELTPAAFPRVFAPGYACENPRVMAKVLNVIVPNHARQFSLCILSECNDAGSEVREKLVFAASPNRGAACRPG